MKAIVARIAQSLGLILAVIVLNFFLIQIAPGDAATAIAGDQSASDPAVLEQIREQYGLDEPLVVQLGIYIGNVVQGDLGTSIWFNEPVTELLKDRIWPTVLLSAASLTFAVVFGVIIGTIAARRPDSLLSHSTTVLALVGFSMPAFWTGLLLLIIVGVNVDFFPVSGIHDLDFEGNWFQSWLDVGQHLILPALTLGIIYLAQYSRLSRASMLEVLESDYVRTARAKGLSERSVTFKHGLRNGIIPVVTIIGLQFGAVMSGAILVESVFAWPGLGRLAFEAVSRRDTPVLLGVLLLVSVTVIIANLLTDLVYRLIDPRIRVSGGANG
ncbi:MAG: ABC transporter permease [Acidimicrobiales bacterium]